MKARVKILVNGAAATLLTGAVAAGLILSSTGALQTKNNDVLAARELDECGLFRPQSGTAAAGKYR